MSFAFGVLFLPEEKKKKNLIHLLQLWETVVEMMLLRSRRCRTVLGFCSVFLLLSHIGFALCLSAFDVFAEVKQGPPGMHCQMEALLYLRVTNIGRQAVAGEPYTQPSAGSDRRPH